MFFIDFFSDFNLYEVFKVGALLLPVIDVVGGIPLVAKIKARTGMLQPAKTTFFSGLILFLFLFAGSYVLDLYEIERSAFSAAGGLILLTMGIEIILNVRIFRINIHDLDNVALTPLAFPLIAGTGTMARLLTLPADYALVNISGGILLNLIWVYIVLHYMNRITWLIGKPLMMILQKMIGLLLLAIGFQLLKDGFLAS